MIDLLPLVFGLGRDEIIANAGIVGGIAMALAVVAMTVVAVLPAYSESWAERIGTTETTPAGPDPKEVVPGRDEPLAAPSSGQESGSESASNAELEESTAVPEPETAGTEQTNRPDAGVAEIEGDDPGTDEPDADASDVDD